MLKAAGESWTSASAKRFLRQLFMAAVASADPLQILAPHLPERPTGRCVVVGAGKAAGAMARAVEDAWPEVDLTGIVVTPYGYRAPTERIVVREAAHPVPDAASEAAARAILGAVANLSADDLVLALISGGGSSVMTLPAPGLTLTDKQITNRALLASGLDIRTMNAIRKRLSAVKGGRLAAAAAPARVVTLGISDIPGDNPAAIASGPTVFDDAAALDLGPAIARLEQSLPRSVIECLRRPPTVMQPSSHNSFRMIATPAQALQAAARVARDAGLDAIILGDSLEGEASELGAQMAAFGQRRVDTPTVFLSGGETTVTIGDRKAGRGGRNTEFLLSLARALNGARSVWALAGDTDGEDGANGGAAGAVIDPSTIERGRLQGLDINESLVGHDSGTYFERLDDLVITGPTLTNVNDFRAILVIPEAG